MAAGVAGVAPTACGRIATSLRGSIDPETDPRQIGIGSCEVGGRLVYHTIAPQPREVKHRQGISMVAFAAPRSRLAARCHPVRRQQ